MDQPVALVDHGIVGVADDQALRGTFYGTRHVSEDVVYGADLLTLLHAEAVKISPEERSTAVRAAQIMGLNIAGVDILRSNHGPVVMEVNSSPGLEGIEGATGIDVAAKIIEFIEKNAAAGKTRDRGKG